MVHLLISRAIFALIVLAVAGAASPTRAGDRLDYLLRVISPGEHRSTVLRVCVSLTANEEGKTAVSLPNAWGRGSGFYRRLEGFRVEGAKLVRGDEPDQLTLMSVPNARVMLCYDVKSNLAAEEEASMVADFSQPLVGSKFIHAFGPQIFPWVDGRDTEIARVALNVPDGWRLASDLEHLPEGATMSDVFNSVILAGTDIEIAETKVGITSVTVAMRGPLRFDRQKFQSQLTDVIRRENSFWNSGPANFLVTVIPMDAVKGQEGIKGSARRDAFALIATPNVPSEAIGFTFAHEYFHNWNLKQLGGYRDGGLEIEDRWLSEGFTDYFARKIARDAGILSDNTFRQAWEEVHERHAHSRAGNFANTQIAQKIGEPDVEQLPYDRGALFACYLETRLESKGKALQPYMLAMRARAQYDPSFSTMSAGDRLTSVMRGDIPNISSLITRYIEIGERLPSQNCH